MGLIVTGPVSSHTHTRARKHAHTGEADTNMQEAHVTLDHAVCSRRRTAGLTAPHTLTDGGRRRRQPPEGAQTHIYRAHDFII